MCEMLQVGLTVYVNHENADKKNICFIQANEYQNGKIIFSHHTVTKCLFVEILYFPLPAP
jgi:hypothetical protein